MSRRKNLRLHNIDTDSDPRLLVRTAYNEASSPSSDPVGEQFDALCLISFAIRDDAPNVPPLGIYDMDNNAGFEGPEARALMQAGMYRMACHAMPYNIEDESSPHASHHSQFLKNPIKEAKTKEQFLFWALKYPIYVGDFIEEGLINTPPIPRGTPIVVRENSVQGGTYGTIENIFKGSGFDISTQFAPGTPTADAAYSSAGPIQSPADTGTPSPSPAFVEPPTSGTGTIVGETYIASNGDKVFPLRPNEPTHLVIFYHGSGYGTQDFVLGQLGSVRAGRTFLIPNGIGQSYDQVKATIAEIENNHGVAITGKSLGAWSGGGLGFANAIGKDDFLDTMLADPGYVTLLLQNPPSDVYMEYRPDNWTGKYASIGLAQPGFAAVLEANNGVAVLSGQNHNQILKSILDKFK